MEKICTAEFVTPKHPDKLCDLVADTLLDSYIAGDPSSRVALEVCGGHDLIVINGEVTSTASPEVEKQVKQVVGDRFKVMANIVRQSPYIAQGVDSGGAGDQGIMVGYACRETPELMPLEYQLARSLCQKIFAVYPVDGKVQVTLRGAEVTCVVASFQGTKSPELEARVREIISSEKYLINPAGEWPSGGFDADTGVSGRKLVVDNYGSSVPLGGGSFSGKDYTKVDRTGAYMARKVAVDLLHKRGANRVLVKLAYAIGVAEPVMAVAELDGVQEDIQQSYDFRPASFPEQLALSTVKYSEVCQWGHFGKGYPWDLPF